VKEQMSDIERRILAEIQQGLPITRQPYKDIAQRTGISEEQLLTVLKDWKRQGKIRRIGAVIDHFKTGQGAGAMVVWEVAAANVERVGTILAGFKEVSHAYERETSENWPFNLYTMVHAKHRDDIKRIVEKMSDACGVGSYRVLFTERQLKKVSPVYVDEKFTGKPQK
jgi:DNA-binding Lrp family transcriptional regulator